jgi:hypothetical protein
MAAMNRIMTRITTRIALLMILTVLAAPARAADAVYPTGSRIGMTPPPGLTQSHSFFGFEDATNNVAFVLVGIPPEAYGELSRSLNAAGLRQQGLTFEKRENLAAAAGNGFLILARQEIETIKLRKWIAVVSNPALTALVTVQIPDTAKAVYPDATVRAALASIAVRAEVPVEEQLSLLPFKVGDLANFRIGGLLPGRALMLTDAPANAPQADSAAQFTISIAAGGPSQVADRSNFARDTFATVPNIRDVRIVSAEPLRILGQPGHQIMAEGKYGASGVDVTIVQWMRFGGGGYMHMLGISPTPQWTPTYARFRQVRDSVDTH